MTIIFVPRLIDSAEQAESLPIGTVVQHPGMVEVAVRSGVSVDGKPLWYGTDDKRHDAPSLVGWTALVPIEAEEVRVIERGLLERDMHGRAVLYQEPTPGARDYRRTEYRTPWEEA